MRDDGRPGTRSIPVPEGVDDRVFAAIANPGMSAWLSLRRRAPVSPARRYLSWPRPVCRDNSLRVARQLGADRVIGAGRNIDAIAAQDVDAVIALAQSEDAVREAFLAE